MNENGYSFVESILSLVILMIIFASIIPISYTMKTNLSNKKQEVYAAETAYEGMKLAINNGITEGSRTIDGINYYWIFDGQQICVSFKRIDDQRKKCINATGEVK